MHTLSPVACLVLGLTLAAPAMAQNSPKKEAAKPAAAAAAATAEKGRDWRKIDTNGDHYISPEEMEAWLKANPGPQR